jgi:hypothetical protein
MIQVSTLTPSQYKNHVNALIIFSLRKRNCVLIYIEKIGEVYKPKTSLNRDTRTQTHIISMMVEINEHPRLQAFKYFVYFCMFCN